MKTSIFIFTAIVIILAAGVGFLSLWDIPWSSTPVEKVIPNDRLFY